MPEKREDERFHKSTMTFGQHLEELRSCLIKSLIGLAVGFIIGLTVGGRVVAFIQLPLTQALTEYYQRESIDRVDREMARLKASGTSQPWTEAEVRRRVKTENLLADEVYVDPAELFTELRNAYPEQLKGVEAPLPVPSSEKGQGGMIRLFLWHRGADDARLQSKGLSVFEGFSVYIKASLLVGALLAGPWIFYQIWSFVAAGLYPHERHYVEAYLPFSIVLFLAGAALAFFVVFGPVLDFLLSFNRTMDIGPEPRINEWLSFVWILPVGFGVGFQLPLVMLFLERIGVCTVQTYLSYWRVAVMTIFIIAGILMPPDPYSMLLNAAALTLLYFGGILLCKMMPRKASPR